jgi:galactokinase
LSDPPRRPPRQAPERAAAFAPGRVNLIGEHTDYNQGLALPFAITEGVTVTAAATRGRRIEALALDLGEEDAFELADPAPTRGGWRAFVRGTAAELAVSGAELAGARLEISGTVPRGAGLSSSAALEVALCLALVAIGGGEPPDRRSLAQLCSRVENRWVGAQTGLLDQLASLFGRAGAAIRIDFRTLAIDTVRLELDQWRLVTLDSGERHAHGDSGYNERRLECARACEALGLSSLRDADAAMLPTLPSPLAERARHVIEENGRVERMVAALARRDLAEVGRLLDQSHASLRDLYEVSTERVEATVAVFREAGAAGARIVGGGFGGHVLGLMPPGAQPPGGALEVKPGPGAHLLADR